MASLRLASRGVACADAAAEMADYCFASCRQMQTDKDALIDFAAVFARCLKMVEMSAERRYARLPI